MIRLVFTLICALCLIACNQKSDDTNKQHQSEQLPNIIMLVGDDQGYPYFGFMGADYVHTPNMDKLADEGTLFTQGYVPDNHCRPSLQTLMTGTLPIQYENRVAKLIEEEKKKEGYQNLSQKEEKEWEREFRFHAMKYFTTLPRILAEHGYVSFQGGKWWEFSYQNGGFTEGMTKGWSKEDEGNRDWFQKFMGGDGTKLARVTMKPVYDFIEKHSDNPFFIWYAPELPHYPFDAPEKYYNMYKDKNMSESAKRYYANCTWFDDGVGELITYLKQKGKYQNTLFIYVNDNGWEQNPEQEFRHDSLRWHNGGDKGKLSLYDQSFRTPIIFSWKNKIGEGIVKEDLIHSADVPATILDYIGIPIPEGYFGKSYRDIIEGKKSDLRSEIIGNINQIRWEGDMMGKNIEGYWLRNKDWFFSWNCTDSTKALFDMNQDPLNNKNLADDYPELVEKFSRKITEWEKQEGK
ncbi:sulfatase [Bacteroidota bacterium]